MISQEYKSNFVCAICESLQKTCWASERCLKDWFQSRLNLIGQSQQGSFQPDVRGLDSWQKLYFSIKIETILNVIWQNQIYLNWLWNISIRFIKNKDLLGLLEMIQGFNLCLWWVNLFWMCFFNFIIFIFIYLGTIENQCIE